MNVLQSILVPTDFETASDTGFTHGLALALAAKARLKIVHVGKAFEDNPPWHRYPAVRDTLSQWGLVSADVGRQDVEQQIGILIGKLEMHGRDPASAITRYINDHSTDLVVVGTEARSGLLRLVKQSTAVKISQEIRLMTLFIPEQVGGFVDKDNGAVTLKRILVPVDSSPDPDSAVRVSEAVAALFKSNDPVSISIVHVGESLPEAIKLPEDDSAAAWSAHCLTGDPLEVIAEQSEKADLLVMATAGRRGLFETFLGSTAERVLERSRCPVLTVPS